MDKLIGGVFGESPDEEKKSENPVNNTDEEKIHGGGALDKASHNRAAAKEHVVDELLTEFAANPHAKIKVKKACFASAKLFKATVHKPAAMTQFTTSQRADCACGTAPPLGAPIGRDGFVASSPRRRRNKEDDEVRRIIHARGSRPGS